MTSCEAGSVGIDIEHKHAAMKFCKRYREYMQRHQDRLPGVTYVEFKKFKKVLKHCTARYHKRKGKICGLEKGNDSDGCDIGRACHSICPKCDQAFFPSLLDEMAAVVCCFNARAKRLLDLHLATGFRKYLIWMTSKLSANHMIQEGKNLMSYASINAIAIRKILKKYDKVHCSKQGREFRMRAQAMHMEILQSPLLNELIAFHINLMDSGNNCAFISDLYADCSLTFEDEKPYLSCTLLDSVRLDVDLTCSICLETVFDPISLKCGHIFCYSCACSAASVTVVDGLKKADHNSKCPLCRQARVYEDAVHLVELSILLSKSCKDYWEQRLQRERVQRLQQAKEHWESQCRAFMGFGT